MHTHTHRERERERPTHLQRGSVHDEVVSYKLANSLLLVGRCRSVDLRQRVVHLNKCIKVWLVNHAVAKCTRHVWVRLGCTYHSSIRSPGLQQQTQHQLLTCLAIIHSLTRLARDVTESAKIRFHQIRILCFKSVGFGFATRSQLVPLSQATITCIRNHT